MDANDVLKSPLGKFLERTGITQKFLRGSEAIFPMARVLGFSMIPRPERFYFYFWVGEPTDTKRFAGGNEAPEVLFALREEIRQAVETGIEKLKAIRAQDPGRTLIGSLLGTQRGGPPDRADSSG